MEISDGSLPTALARLDRLLAGAGRAVSWLTAAMVGLLFVIVVLRYVFDLGWIALQESVTWAHVAVLLLAAAWTLGEDAHVRVDVFYRRAQARTRALVDLVGTFLLLLPVSVFLLWQSVPYAARSWRIFESSPEPGGLPGFFLLKTVIPLAAVMLILQGVVQAARCWRTIRRG